MKNEPKRIYIQVYGHGKDTDFNEVLERTHSTERYFDEDLEYYSKSEVIELLEWILYNNYEPYAERWRIILPTESPYYKQDKEYTSKQLFNRYLRKKK